MPRDFISADGFGITEKCRRYLRAADRRARTTRRTADGLPVYATLKNVAVPKKLAAFELEVALQPRARRAPLESAPRAAAPLPRATPV